MRLKQALAALACSLATACATPLAPQQQTFENVQLLSAPDIPQMALGEFALAKGLPVSMDKSLGIRADSVTPPAGLTFSGYLKQTLEAELTGAGKLNPSAPVVISAELTQSHVSTSGASSNGVLAARFHVTRNGAVAYDKELVVTEEWPASFFGAEAIPAAMNHYNGFYPKLVTKLLQDTDFRAAVR
jgi:hypothetical protein